MYGIIILSVVFIGVNPGLFEHKTEIVTGSC